MTHSLRLVTINTWKCDGNYPERLALLKTQIADLQADVIACQEVFRAGDRADTGRDLADALGLHYAFAPARYKPRHFQGQLTDSYSGLGLLSRFPILNTETVLFPPHPDDTDRLAQLVWLNVAGASVLVVNTHLTHLHGQSAMRQAQLATLLAHPALAQPHHAAVFVCGDFNAEQSSPEIQFLLNHPTISAQNTYQSGNGIAPGYTMPDRDNHPTARDRCIDFIFSLTTDNRPHPVIAEARVVLDVADVANNYPSDHCGVLITAWLNQP
jgi:endonuclease/exonuclease/phosphatase family metal-dependent hydrolase